MWPRRRPMGKREKLCLVFARGATAGRFCSIGRLTGGTTFAYGRERKMTERECEDLTAFIVRVQSKRERDKTSLPTENDKRKLGKKRGKGRQNLKEWSTAKLVVANKSDKPARSGRGTPLSARSMGLCALSVASNYNRCRDMTGLWRLPLRRHRLTANRAMTISSHNNFRQFQSWRCFTLGTFATTFSGRHRRRKPVNSFCLTRSPFA